MAFKGITAFILNNGEGGGGGEPTGNYNDLTNKPQINGNELSGNKTADQLGLLPADTNIPTKLSDLEADTTHRTITDSEKQSWNNKVDSVAGKGLSTNDYTDDDQEDVAKIDGLVSSVGSLTSRVGITEGKVGTLEGEMISVQNALDTKVDKVAGKGLSTNDYDDTDKGKVDSLGTASAKNAISVVTDSSDLVESGAVKDIVGWGNKNLFDPANIRTEVIATYVHIYVGSGNFTMSTNMPINTQGGANLFILAGNVSTGASTATNGLWSGQTRTVTAIDGYVTVASRNTDGVNPVNYNHQLEKGTVATAYEPYHASVEEYCASKQDVEDIVGWGNKNLFNKNDVENGIINESGAIAIVGEWKSSKFIKVTPSEKYIISGLNISYASSSGFAFYNSAKTFVSGGGINVFKNTPITIPDNVEYIRFSLVLADLDTAQLEVGSTATAYEPYHASVEESKCDNSVISPVENGTIASQAYAVGSHAIRNGAFITWKNAKAQGETINDASDYTSGDVADELDRIDGQIAIIEKKLFPPSILYAFHIDGNESDPLSKVRYLEDCAGYSPAYMDFQNGIFHYGSWSENEFFMPRPCMLRYNGTVDYYLAKHDYTKKADGVTASDVADTAYNGNAMLEFGRDNKKIWYKVVPDSGDDSSFTVYISDGQVDEDFHCWSFINNQGYLVPKFYLSIYNGSVISDVMRSLSGQAVSKSLTGTQEREKARANNQTSDRLWDIECFADYQLLELLTWLIGKSTDSQAVFGKGLTESGSEAINNDFRTGVQNAKGLFFGTNSGAAATYTNAIKVFGKENLWGFQWRRLNGWCMNDGVQKIKLTKGIQDGSTATDYNDDGTNYLNMGSTPSGSSGGYVSAAYSNNKGIVIPKIASGNSVSHYCDGLWFNNSGARMALVGGASNAGAPCGVSCATLHASVSSAYWAYGASLSCKPLA